MCAASSSTNYWASLVSGKIIRESMTLLILNFHGIGPIPREIIEEERACWLDQDHFEAILNLAQGQSHVQLTFDDGNVSDLEIALPALMRRGLRANFFICSDRLDQPTFLNQTQVRELMAHGMDIGSHGAGHISWRHLPPFLLNMELVGSKNALEKVCGVPIESAACPLGAYDRHVLTALRQAGYKRVYTSDGGRVGDSEWLQARTTVVRSNSASSIAQLIRHGPGAWEQSSIDLRKLFKRHRW